MKQFILSVAIVFISIAVHAQEPVLATGHYIIVIVKQASDVNNTDINVRECDIMTGKDGTFVTFLTSPKSPELALKPIRVIIQDESFIFSVCPTDYVTPNAEHGTMQTETYVGRLIRGKLIGAVTSTGGWASETKPVLYYKQQAPK